MPSRLSDDNARRRRPTRRRVAGPANGQRGANPVTYAGLEASEGGDMPDELSVGETPNEAVRELVSGRRTEPLIDEEPSLPTPESRMDNVLNKTPEYSKEYRLGLLHRLLLRKIPLDEIAEQLNVSVRTIQRDRADLNRIMQKEAADMSVNEYVGDTIGFFKEVRALTMRIGTASKNSLPARLAALSRAMQAQKDMTAVLAMSGGFDVLKFKATDTGGSNELQELVRMAEIALSDDDVKDSIEDMTTNTVEDSLDEYLTLL